MGKFTTHAHGKDFVNEPHPAKSKDGRSPQEKARDGERDKHGRPVKR